MIREEAPKVYQPRAFRQTDATALDDLIRDFPFATLVIEQEGLAANHLPLLLRRRGDGRATLVGHLARANPMCDEGFEPVSALAIFHGPQGYISPNWYPSKARDGRAVPTWNYAVVHVRGTLTLEHDPRWLRALLNQLTDHMESGFDTPWRLQDAPEDYLARMIAATVGVRLEVREIEGKWKLSQNQPEENQKGVISGLGRDRQPELAAWVEKVTAGG
nr:FMN-binding negative transcriptional regulator [Alloalcanivorax xenomutans]